MGEHTTVAPIRRSVTVKRSVEDAFRIFVYEIGTWWPLGEHSIDADRATTAVIEPTVGGRVYERWDDGTTEAWGEVLAFEPPHRLVLAWQPNPDRPAPTEVEVRFTADGDLTRVDLEHRGWERLGDVGPEARTSYDRGWPGTLDRFVAAASS